MGTLTLLGLVIGTLYVPADRWLLDAFHLVRSNRPPVHDSLVVVAIDRKFGERTHFPEITPRDYLARLITKLTAQGARAIALDVIVARDDSTEAVDALVSAVESAPPVILPTSLQPYRLRRMRAPSYELVMEPPPRLRQHTQGGYITFFGGTRPEMKLVTRLADDSYRRPDIASLQGSLAFTAVAAFYDGKLPPVSEPERRWGKMLDELDYPSNPASDRIEEGFESRPVNYVGPVEPGSGFRYISSEDLLRAPVLGPGTIDGKLVLIGVTYPNRDLHETPWGPMHGVEVHANIINSLLTKTYLRRYEGTATKSIMMLLAVLPALLLFSLYWRTPPRWWSAPTALAAFSTTTAVLFFFAFLLFDQPSGIVLPTGLGLKTWVFATFTSCTLMAALGHARVRPPSHEDDCDIRNTEVKRVPPTSPVSSEEKSMGDKKWWTYLILGVLGGLVLAFLYPWRRS